MIYNIKYRILYIWYNIYIICNTEYEIKYMLYGITNM